MGLSMLERQSSPVAWGGFGPQQCPPHPLPICCSSPWLSGWRWRWPSGTASMTRAGAMPCRWTRICATSWIGAGQLTSRTSERPCLGSRFAASWGWDGARGPLLAGGAGGPDPCSGFPSTNAHQRFRLALLSTEVHRASPPLSADCPGWSLTGVRGNPQDLSSNNLLRAGRGPH
jgi:hypothetical protein